MQVSEDGSFGLKHVVNKSPIYVHNKKPLVVIDGFFLYL